jgi:hypothetical protein
MDHLGLVSGMPLCISEGAQSKVSKIVTDLSDLNCMFVSLNLPLTWEIMSGTTDQITQQIRHYIVTERAKYNNVKERVFIGNVKEIGENVLELNIKRVCPQPRISENPVKGTNSNQPFSFQPPPDEKQ